MQTERLENHTARLTVEVVPERFEKAMQAAARKIARQVNIPGFRRGKAPYRIVKNYVGEGALLEDAVEILGNEVYREALEASELEPYAPGQLEDVELENTPTFKFIVPLQPTVELNEYRSVRVDYEAPTIEDDEVDNTLQALREQNALVEESHQPVQPGNRVTIDIHGQMVVEDDDDEAKDEDEDDVAASDADTEAETDTGDGHEEHHHQVDENTIIHEHDAVMNLDADNEPIPGFVDALTGATVGETREFTLTYPDDEDAYQEMAGETARFSVTVKKIETVTLPELNDQFAANVTEEEDEPLTLLQLRMRIRENLQNAADERATNAYAQDVLTQIVEQADIHYPEEMVQEQVDQMLERFDQQLRQQRLTLDTYMTLYNKTKEDLFEENREAAEATVRRSLVLYELLRREGIGLEEADVEAEIDRMMANFGEHAEQLRSLFAQESMRDNIANDLLNRKVYERLAAIGKGEAPELPDPASDTPTTEDGDEGSKGESAS